MALPYPVKPVHPSPVVRWNNGNLSATRQFLVPSEFVDDFMEYLITSTGFAGTCGLPTTFPGWGSVFVDTMEATPISPCCFATPSGLGYLEDPATELEGYGSGSMSDANDTCWWKVTVGYATKEIITGQSGVRAGTWVTYNRNMSGTVITLPSRNLYWETSGEQAKEDMRAQMFLPLADINLQWNFVDEDDLCTTEANLLTMQGTINNAAYGSNVFSGACSSPWETGTLLFLGYSTSLEVGTKRIFGSYCTAVETKRTLSMSFKLRRFYALNGSALGWNYDYYDGSDATAGWDRLVDASGNPRYTSTSFANLFI